MKRLLDIAVALVALVLFAPLMVAIGLAVRLTSRGPAIYWSNRVGADNQLFAMPKFRSMATDTPQVATHLLRDSSSHITRVGHLLRKSSLDELPQLWSVLRGDMSLVGPRPALFNQHDLIGLRTACGVHRLRPGITGWAQINGRDELEIQQKVSFDEEYLHCQCLHFDLKIIGLTFVKVLRRDGVQQCPETSTSVATELESPRRAA